MKRIWQPICFTALTLFWACGTASNDEDTSDNTYNEDSGTGGGDQNSSGNMHETDASTEITDTAGDTIPGNSGDCTPDATSCDGIILLRCINGSWQQWDDCSIYGKVCTVQQGVYQCVSVGGGADTGLDTTDESDADSVSQSDSGHRDTSDTASWRDDSGWNADSDTGRRQDGETDVDTETDTETAEPVECDGANVDCYSECWGCALTSMACRPAIENCISDNGCAALYACRQEVCCQGDNTCLVGDEMEDCMNDCLFETNTSDDEEAMALHWAIQECIACDVCEVSCAENESKDFVMCVNPDEMNTVDNPCYEDDAEYDQTACYTWAGSVGPCAEVTSNCINVDACAELERCVNNTWQYDDWHARQDVCYAEAGATVEELYWDYVQCIYCDACDIACLKDAGSKNCDEYDGK